MEISPNNKSNKIFFIILGLLILLSVGTTFYKIVILKNYQMVAEVTCDPTIERCFVFECDPTTDNTCSVPVTYYKNISKNAASISACEATEEKIGCNEELSCIQGESNCSYIYCDSAKLEDGEKCAE